MKRIETFYSYSELFKVWSYEMQLNGPDPQFFLEVGDGSLAFGVGQSHIYFNGVVSHFPYEHPE